MKRVILIILVATVLASCCSTDRPAGYPSHYPWYKRMWYLPC